jgi:hypothetical protein
MTWATPTPGATAAKCARRTVLRGVTRAILPADHELRTGLSALRRVCRACVRTFPVQKRTRPEGRVAEATGTLEKYGLLISWLPCSAHLEIAAGVPDLGARMIFGTAQHG